MVYLQHLPAGANEAMLTSINFVPLN